MSSPIDLRQLAVERPAESPLPRRRHRLMRWGLPLAIVAGFASLLAWSARDHWLPARPVTVAPVLLVRADVQQAGTPLFQAAGWIEPRPTAVVASALVEGVVQELLVIEGQEVEAGQPLARLVDADARLAMQEAEAELALRSAERDSIRASLAAAQTNLDQPVHLQAALAESEAALAALDLEIENLPFALRAAEARQKLARQDLEGKQSVADAIPGRTLQRAQSEFDAATAAVEELRQRAPGLQAQRQAAGRKAEALRTQLELKTDETRALGQAKANLAVAEARLSQARLAVESARLRLERSTIRAPIAGRILSLHAHPGQRLMGLAAASERDASTVATLYDPRQLQVRADVRLEDVPQVQLGQGVQIRTSAASRPLSGRVLAVVSQADIQKNTLSVKVAIDDPPAVIRPEMLAQVTFLAPEVDAPSIEDEQSPLRLLVDRELIAATDGGDFVWVAEAGRTVARRRSVQVGHATAGGLVEITHGLSALDRLIVQGRDGLSDGQRIRVVGEDRSLGAARAAAALAAAQPDAPTRP